MPKPMLLVAVARSKTVRRLVAVAVALNSMLLLGIVVPLVAVPAVLAGTSSGASSGRPTVVGEWGYPLAGDYSKTDGFGFRSVQACAYCSTDHKGYDMAQRCEATVYAAGPGTVVRAEGLGGLGNAVEIDHGGDVSTIYGHMMWRSLLVVPGTRVAAGTPLGLEGSTGTSTGCHLHFEVRIAGVAVDPALFMADRGLPLK